MDVWLNGSFIDRDQATISVFDAGFQHGVGLFETLLARKGRVFRPEQHIQRLADSARDLLLTERLNVAPLVEAVQQTVTHNKMESARVRLTLTGGNLNLLQSTGEGQVDPTLLIVAQPPTSYPDGFFERGVTVMIADGRENPFTPNAGHKTLNYWPRIRALQLAGARQAAEAIWFTVSNHLAAGSVSNIFLVKDDELLTPIARTEEEQGTIPSSVLPGITRSVMLEFAESEDRPVRRKMLDINDLLGADEVFLTNSSWGVLPVSKVEKETIADGTPGPVTRDYRRRWLELIESDDA